MPGREWRAGGGGLRVANTQLDRDVSNQILFGGSTDWADIAFRSDKWGVGPTIGGGLSTPFAPGPKLTISASASAPISRFDLSRTNTYTDQCADQTERRAVTLDTSGVVPMFDASVELKAEQGRYFANLGYTASAWLGGARSIITPGWDDTTDETTPYTIRNEDLITRGVFVRAASSSGLRGDGVGAQGSQRLRRKDNKL